MHQEAEKALQILVQTLMVLSMVLGLMAGITLVQWIVESEPIKRQKQVNRMIGFCCVASVITTFAFGFWILR